MASTDIINGTSFGVYFDWYGEQMIGYGTGCSINITQETRGTTTQATGIWNTRTLGSKDWEVTCDGLVAMGKVGQQSAGLMWNQIYQVMLEESNPLGYYEPTFTLRFKGASGTSGDQYFEGPAILTALSLDAPMETTTTMSVSFIGIGPLVLVTV